MPATTARILQIWIKEASIAIRTFTHVRFDCRFYLYVSNQVTSVSAPSPIRRPSVGDQLPFPSSPRSPLSVWSPGPILSGMSAPASASCVVLLQVFLNRVCRFHVTPPLPLALPFHGLRCLHGEEE
jgi:hypothetical protein